ATFGDIVITPLAQPVLSGNAGEESHGYVEYRFLVENRSETDGHKVTLTMPRWRNGFSPSPHLSANRRTFEVRPRSTLPVSLWQPGLAMINNSAEVATDGRAREDAFQVPVPTNRGSRYQAHFFRGGPPGHDFHVLAPQDMAAELQTNAYKSAVER